MKRKSVIKNRQIAAKILLLKKMSFRVFVKHCAKSVKKKKILKKYQNLLKKRKKYKNR